MMCRSIANDAFVQLQKQLATGSMVVLVANSGYEHCKNDAITLQRQVPHAFASDDDPPMRATWTFRSTSSTNDVIALEFCRARARNFLLLHHERWGLSSLKLGNNEAVRPSDHLHVLNCNN